MQEHVIAENVPVRPARWRTGLYAAVVLLSAILLFFVQPMIGKAMLPQFGGSAHVWAICLACFQTLLLAGYLYAHGSQRWLSPKAQVTVHMVLLAASCAALPIGLRAGGDAASQPAWGVVRTLLLSAGFPYLMLSTTSPLIQAWYSRSTSAGLPYRLYALSNLGSLAALLGYPVLVEPWLGIRNQTLAWSWAYAVFVLLAAAAALLAWHAHRSQPVEARSAAPAARTWALWLGLAATGSALLVGVTNHLTQDVAPVPFLWVLPLALYLLSFVLCFESDKWYQRGWIAWVLPLALGGMGLLYGQPGSSMALAICGLAGGAFIAFMFCHGELAALRPEPEHLTSFYVSLALGGASGGTFVALAAPVLFTSNLEFPLALLACCLFAVWLVYEYRSPVLIALLAVVGVITLTAVLEMRILRPALAATRNFYGVLQVTDGPEFRSLYHGRISHGLQFNREPLRPGSYFGSTAGVGRAMRLLGQGPRRIGVIGLGVATLASYGRAGDVLRFYEINPAVEEFARRFFRFLPDCPARTEVLLGDGRLVLEREPPQNYDLFVIDAFSGDAIPVHLLTREAFAAYRRHLRPGGVIAIHITNRFLNLAPEVAALARDCGMHGVLVTNPPAGPGLYRSDWAILADHPEILNAPELGQNRKLEGRHQVWTDDYSNLLGVLR